MKNRQPNVVLVNIDECKASVIGCYGNKEAYTPNIDRIAEGGVTFTNSFTTFPKCVPSRCAMITGRYPHVEGHRTLPGFQITRGENNIILELKKRGYTTAMFGHNHLLEEDLLDEYFDCRTRVWRGKRDDGFAEDPNLYRAFYRENLYSMEDLHDFYHTQDACDFIDAHGEEPFFLLVNIGVPHPTYKNIREYIDTIRARNVKVPPREDLERAPEVLKAYRRVYDLEMLREEDWKKIIEAYYSMVSFADYCVGKIHQKIEEKGLASNTVFIFTSDHGDFAGEHGCVEKWDTMFYDCLIKVPLIIQYPPRLKAGLKVDALVENVDLVPTMMELCGLEVPSWVQGKSLVGVMEGRDPVHKEAVFCEGGVEPSAIEKALPYTDEHYKRNPHYYKQRVMIDYPWTMARAKMVRTKKWKLIFRVNGMKELYDLEKDPLELCNVADKPENKEILYELTEKLLVWAIETETDYPPVKIMHA